MTTGGSGRRPLRTRLAAALSGEATAAAIEAYRRAGAAAYEVMETADAVRTEIVASGADLWSVPVGWSSQLLCAWNAFALQTLGDELVEADYRADPRTVGYLPKATAEQAAAFLGQVEAWLTAARRAAADPGFDISTQMSLPAALPPWVEAEPCPRVHVDAMLAAARALRGRAEAAVADFRRTRSPALYAPVVARLAGMAADAGSVLSYAEALWSPRAKAEIYQRVEDSLKRGIVAYYALGQLLAMPSLVEEPLAFDEPSGSARRPDSLIAAIRRPSPGQPGFDPWCLTDEPSRLRFGRDPGAWHAITTLWRHDPDPAATLTLRAEIDAALAAEAVGVALRPDGRSVGYYFRCPWSTIYEARRPVRLGGVTLHREQQFVLDVSVEGTSAGGEVVRQILTGPFHPPTVLDQSLG